jgi:hypothetical protein
MLISGFPGNLILIPLGFACAIFLYSFFYFKKGKKNVNIEPAFIIATFLTLLFGHIILGFL